MNSKRSIEATTLIEEGREFLNNFQPDIALKRFEEAISLVEMEVDSEFSLLCLWAELMTLSGGDELGDSLLNIENQLDKIPSEDRNNPLYYFVKGLLEKRCGRTGEARNSFGRAVELDKKFVAAQREFRVICNKSN